MDRGANALRHPQSSDSPSSWPGVLSHPVGNPMDRDPMPRGILSPQMACPPGLGSSLTLWSKGLAGPHVGLLTFWHGNLHQPFPGLGICK